MKKNPYQLQTMFGGWTRIDMLLAIYDRAIGAVEAAAQADADQDAVRFGQKMLEAQKCILAIHGGLKPDEHEIAFNIARLINFVLTCLEQKKFEEGLKILKQLRASFQQIHAEATQLEKSGKIPPIDFRPEINTVA